MLDLLLSNANGLTVADKYEEFTNILTTYNPEFLALNETLLKSEDTEFLNIKLRSVNYNNNHHIFKQSDPPKRGSSIYSSNSSSRYSHFKDTGEIIVHDFVDDDK